MKKTGAVLAVLLLFLAGTVCASAVELQAGPIRAFTENILTVSCEDGGSLTIEAWNGALPLENPVTDLRIEAGTTEIPWDGLSYGGEPVPAGKITLRATLTGTGRTVEQAEVTSDAVNPMPAAVCCLPAAQRFYPDGRSILKIELGMSFGGAWEITAAPKDNPEDIVWHQKGRSDGKFPEVLRWNGMRRAGVRCEAGEYVISAWTKGCPDHICTATVTLLEEPLPDPKITVTGSLIPEDLSDDAAVWAALSAPVAIGDGAEGGGFQIMEEKGARRGNIGTVNGRTAGMAVLELTDDGWAKVGAWRNEDGRYIEGWVKTDRLRVIRPNDRYGAVVDKKAQTMTIYEDGKKIGTLLVSTGFTTEEDRTADTHSGVYLMGTRIQDFTQGKHHYLYPVRIDGPNLIHSAGYVTKDGLRSYEEEIAALGTKASHGCIRMDPRTTDENGGINAWWVWTHMGHDTKIIVTPDE